jgi:hypothetical protein
MLEAGGCLEAEGPLADKAGQLVGSCLCRHSKVPVNLCTSLFERIPSLGWSACHKVTRDLVLGFGVYGLWFGDSFSRLVGVL